MDDEVLRAPLRIVWDVVASLVGCGWISGVGLGLAAGTGAVSNAPVSEC